MLDNLYRMLGAITVAGGLAFAGCDILDGMDDDGEGDACWECEGSGTMTADIGGDPFEAFCVSASNAGGYIQLGAVYCTEGQNTNENSISIYSTATAPGTYEFDPYGDNQLNWGWNGETGVAQSGTITFAEVTDTGCAGTFDAVTTTFSDGSEVIVTGEFTGTFAE